MNRKKRFKEHEGGSLWNSKRLTRTIQMNKAFGLMWSGRSSEALTLVEPLAASKDLSNQIALLHIRFNCSLKLEDQEAALRIQQTIAETEFQKDREWPANDDHLSDFLMRSICDVLCCGEYDTAEKVLKEMGWTAAEGRQEDLPMLDMDAMLKQKSMYGADAICGCAYDKEKDLLVSAKVDKGDSRNSRMMIYQKE